MKYFYIAAKAQQMFCNATVNGVKVESPLTSKHLISSMQKKGF